VRGEGFSIKKGLRSRPSLLLFTSLD